MLKVRLLPLPPNTMFEVETSVGLDEVAERSKLSTGVSPSPIVKAITGDGVSSRMDWSGMLERLGGSLTAATVRRKVWLLLATPSLTVRVMLAVPFWLVARVNTK